MASQAQNLMVPDIAMEKAIKTRLDVLNCDSRKGAHERDIFSTLT